MHPQVSRSQPTSASAGVLTTPKQDGTPYDVPYGHTRVFIGAGFDQVLERVVMCLQLQGFHIMASVDLQDTLQGAKVCLSCMTSCMTSSKRDTSELGFRAEGAAVGVCQMRSLQEWGRPGAK